LGANIDTTYSIIPNIRFLGPPIKTDIQEAFSASLAVVWQVLIGILGIGALASLLMPNLPLQNRLDEKWAIQGPESDN
jgi:hypothetical protein